MSKNNSYAARARKQGLLGVAITDNDTKNNFKATMAQTGVDLLVGGIAGSFAGHLAGRYGLLAGVAISGTSYYFGSRLGAMFGLGMIASGFVSATTGVNGLGETAATKDVLKQRSKVFFDGLKARLFLDKLKSKKSETSTSSSTPTNGLGNVRYFTYPETDNQTAGPGDLDMSALEKIEQQIAESAQQYQNSQMSGTMSGLNEMLEAPIY